MPHPSSSLSVQPLAPAWIQALIPLLKSALEETAGRDSTIEVVITFDAIAPNIARWKETVSRKVAVNLATRKVERGAKTMFEGETLDDSMQRAIKFISDEGEGVLAELKNYPVGCRQIVLNLKEARLTGIQIVRSIPVRNRTR